MRFLKLSVAFLLFVMPELLSCSPMPPNNSTVGNTVVHHTTEMMLDDPRNSRVDTPPLDTSPPGLTGQLAYLSPNSLGQSLVEGKTANNSDDLEWTEGLAQNHAFKVICTGMRLSAILDGSISANTPDLLRIQFEEGTPPQWITVSTANYLWGPTYRHAGPFMFAAGVYTDTPTTPLTAIRILPRIGKITAGQCELDALSGVVWKN